MAIASSLASYTSNQPLPNELTLEEKIGQLLIVSCPEGDFHNEHANIIDKLHVGGFIYYSWINPLNDLQKIKTLSEKLQTEALKKNCDLPLFISIDQEGGVVSRLSDDFTLYPGNFAIGKTDDLSLCYKASKAMAHELRFAGINLNFAPVVDVIDQSTIPYIGLRSFGSSPKLVTEFAKKAIRGFKKHELLCTLKHFPGHGSAKKDSHFDLPLIEKSLKELEASDLYPFKKLSKEVDFIMTAHMLVPALDDKNPVTISKKAISYLKENLAYKGLVISDSLTMDGILKNHLSIEEAAARALEAGCDILLIGGRRLNERNQILSFEEIQKIHEYLLQCVLSGRIDQSRVDEAFSKVYKIKQKIKKQKKIASFDLKSHQRLSDLIAQKAMFCKMKKNSNFLFNHFFLITSQDLKNKLSKIREDLSFLSGQFSFDQISVEDFTSQDLIIFLSNGLKKNSQDQEIYQRFLENKKSVILIDLTEQLQEDKKAYGVIQTFSNQEASLKLALNKLKEELSSSKTY